MEQLFAFPSDELLQEDTVYITIVQELHATTLTNDKEQNPIENLVSEAKKRISDSDLEEKKVLCLNNWITLLETGIHLLNLSVVLYCTLLLRIFISII